MQRKETRIRHQFFTMYIGNIYIELNMIQRFRTLLNTIKGKLKLSAEEKNIEKPNDLLIALLSDLENYFNKLIMEALVLPPLTHENQVTYKKTFEKVTLWYSQINEAISKYINNENVKKLIDESNKLIIKELSEFYITPLIDTDGICNGLTLWWGLKMSENNESAFYNVIDKITDCITNDKISTDLIKKNEIEFEKYNAHIRFMQNPSLLIPYIEQTSSDVVSDIFIRESSGDALNISMEHSNFQKISEFFSYIFPDRFVIIGQKGVSGNEDSQRGHAIGVFRRNNEYFLFDPNNPSGRAEVFNNTDELTAKIIESYDNLYKKKDRPKSELSVFINKYQPYMKNTIDNQIKFIEFLSKNNTNEINIFRKMQYAVNDNEAINIVAKHIFSDISLELLEIITNKKDKNLLSFLDRKKLLSFAYQHKNIHFIISILNLENDLNGQFSQEDKNNLLLTACNDYLSPTFKIINTKSLEMLIKILIEHGAELHLPMSLPRWLEELIKTHSIHHAGSQEKEIKEDSLNKKNDIAIYQAARTGDFETIKKLEDNPFFDWNQPDSDGRTLVYRAAEAPNLKIMQFLIQKGADLNKPDNNGLTIAHVLAKWARLPSFAGAIFKLKDEKIDWNKSDHEGRTPAHYACMGEIGSILALKKISTIDWNKLDKENKNPAYYIAEDPAFKNPAIALKKVEEGGCDLFFTAYIAGKKRNSIVLSTLNNYGVDIIKAQKLKDDAECEKLYELVNQINQISDKGYDNQSKQALDDFKAYAQKVFRLSLKENNFSGKYASLNEEMKNFSKPIFSNLSHGLFNTEFVKDKKEHTSPSKNISKK